MAESPKNGKKQMESKNDEKYIIQQHYKNRAQRNHLLKFIKLNSEIEQKELKWVSQCYKVLLLSNNVSKVLKLNEVNLLNSLTEKRIRYNKDYFRWRGRENPQRGGNIHNNNNENKRFDFHKMPQQHPSRE